MKKEKFRQLMKKICGGILVFSLAAATPMSVMAENEASVDTVSQSENSGLDIIDSSNLWIDSAGNLRGDAFNGLGSEELSCNISSISGDQDSYPEAYSLRNAGGTAVYNPETGRTEFSGGSNYVTDVKLQNPWGTCWAFGIVAASETSILSELGITAEESGLDLSEHHLSWFIKHHLPTEGEDGYEAISSTGQAGEGFWSEDSAYGSSMAGGNACYGVDAFASGMGIVSESEDPSFTYNGAAKQVMVRKSATEYLYFDSYEAAVEAGEVPFCYSDEDDWSLDESLRFASSYVLEEGLVLPEVNLYYSSGEWGAYNGDIASGENEGINAAKKQLLQGRGITVSYAADTFRPTDEGTTANGRYMNNDNYAQYTWEEDAVVNHMVTIVGYDDNYAASNFTISNPVIWDSNFHVIYKLLTTELANDEDGNPYYMSGENRVYLDKSSTLITDTGKTDEYGNQIYALSGVTLENDSEGNSLIPGSSEILQDRSILCEALREEGTYTPEGDGAWIVKNSWGASDNEFPNKRDWGENGYFYISYYDKSLTDMEVFDFDTEGDSDACDYTDQYDFMTYGTYYGLSSYTKFSTANVFTAYSDEERVKSIKLTSIGCDTTYTGTTLKYELYILDEDYEKPTDGICAATGEAYYEYGGYHRIELETPVYVPIGSSYAVVVTQNCNFNGNNVYVMTGNVSLNENYAEYTNDSYYTKSILNSGESILLNDNEETGETESQDYLDFVNSDDFKEALFGGNELTSSWFDFDNFGIKAFGITSEYDIALECDTDSYVEGEASNITLTIGEGLEGFSSDNIDFDKGITVDGERVSDKYVRMHPGSTRYGLSIRYLNELKSGEHSIRIYLKDSESLAGLPEYSEVSITVIAKPVYSITVENGSATSEHKEISSSLKDKMITITAEDAPEGYVFDKWQVVSGNIKLDDKYSSKTSFIMPSENVTIKATYKVSKVQKGSQSTRKDKSPAKQKKSFIERILRFL